MFPSASSFFFEVLIVDERVARGGKQQSFGKKH